MAKADVKYVHCKQALDELANYEALKQTTLGSVYKWFSGKVKARIPRFGGVLATTMEDYVLKNNGLDHKNKKSVIWLVLRSLLEYHITRYALASLRFQLTP